MWDLPGPGLEPVSLALAGRFPTTAPPGKPLLNSCTVKSAAKAIATQQKSLDSLAEVVFDNRITLGYLLTEQGDVCAMANTTCYTWIDTSEEAETQLHKISEQASCLKRVTPSMGSFSDLFDSD